MHFLPQAILFSGFSKNYENHLRRFYTLIPLTTKVMLNTKAKDNLVLWIHLTRRISDILFSTSRKYKNEKEMVLLP